MLMHGKVKARQAARPDIKPDYSRREEDLVLLDEFLKARADAGLTQAETASLMGTTQSAIARLESGNGRYTPSLSTLRRYAHALGYRLEFKLVREKPPRRRA